VLKNGVPGTAPLKLPYKRISGAVCSRVGCGHSVLVGTLCMTHYMESIGSCESPAMLLGFGYIGDEGYVSVYAPNHENAGKAGRIQEHRLIMALTLHRTLIGGEEVHHRNGRRADNRPENLELWIKSQPAGQRVEDAVAWAKEILARYCTSPA
jgi:hypothetical protein